MANPDTSKDVVNNVDAVIDRIDIVETDSKPEAKNPRHKYIRVTLSDGKIIKWYPFSRGTIPQIEGLVDQEKLKV
jgi:hypothetical protein